MGYLYQGILWLKGFYFYHHYFHIWYYCHYKNYQHLLVSNNFLLSFDLERVLMSLNNLPLNILFLLFFFQSLIKISYIFDYIVFQFFFFFILLCFWFSLYLYNYLRLCLILKTHNLFLNMTDHFLMAIGIKWINQSYLVLFVNGLFFIISFPLNLSVSSTNILILCLGKKVGFR